MYDIEQLENEWKKYRKKKLKPWYFGIVISLFLFIVLVYFFMNEKIDLSAIKRYVQFSNVTSSHQPKADMMKEKKVNSSHVLISEALDRLEIKEKKTLITVLDKPVKNPVNILVDVPLLDDDNNMIVQEASLEDRPKMSLDIVETTSVTAYKDVEKRFMQTGEIEDALFLARSYYKKGDYKKSEFWALETNKLDESSEESLFIFVKSKAKLGRRNEAVVILTDYIKMTDSQEAKKLLYEIENNQL